MIDDLQNDWRHVFLTRQNKHWWLPHTDNRDWFKFLIVIDGDSNKT